LLKILGCMLGAFVGGKWRRAQLAAQNIKVPAQQSEEMKQRVPGE
jgi:hypothetical protein